MKEIKVAKLGLKRRKCERMSLDADCLEIIVKFFLSRHVLIQPNCYGGNDVIGYIDKVFFEDYEVSPVFALIPLVCRQTKSLFGRFVADLEPLVLSRFHSWNWLACYSMKLCDPWEYMKTFDDYENDHAEEAVDMFPVHKWMPARSSITKIVRFSGKTIAKVTVRRETDEENREVHYLTTCLELESHVGSQVRTIRDRIEDVCWKPQKSSAEDNYIRFWRALRVQAIRDFLRQEMLQVLAVVE